MGDSKRTVALRWVVLGEAVLLGALYTFYAYLKVLAHGRASVAHQHTAWLIDATPPPLRGLEANLREIPLQFPIAQNLANTYYSYLHLSVTAGLVIWLMLRRPDGHRAYRLVLVAVTATALLFFWLFPVAPPRLTESLPFLPPIPDQASEPYMNPYAAFPSLHFAWSAWCAWVIMRTSRNRIAKLAWIYPFLTALVILATANHFILDLVGGGVILAIAVAVVERRRVRTPADALLDVQPHEPHLHDLHPHLGLSLPLTDGPIPEG